MEIFGLLLLSMSLSIDAFTIGTSCALGGIKASWKSRLIICAISVLIMGISIFCGEALARFISQEVARYIGCGMLCILGIYIIFGSFARNKKPKRKSITLALKPLGITISIIREPSLCDIDNSNTIDSKEACYIGTALSIDSIGAGVSMGVSGIGAISAAGLCGAFQLIFLCCGLFLGKKLRGIERIPSEIFTRISGLVIILIAVIKLFI